MKISRRWLMDFLSPSGDMPNAADLAALLTGRGLEVESHADVAVASGLLAGKVLSVTPHPSAKKSQVCTVDMGGRTAQIICNAPNVAAGQMVVVAPPKARLGSAEISKREIQGVESEGMICSAAEIGLFDDSVGILILADESTGVQAGMCLDAYLQLNDVILDINITPNRGDCLSHLGVAREVAAATGLQLSVFNDADNNAINDAHNIANLQAVHQQLFALTGDEKAKNSPPKSKNDSPFSVELQSDDCPYYGCAEVRGVSAAQPSPPWMQARLHRCGARCVSTAVDITNYVMLALGQPLHAFDLDKLHGGIRVRMAERKEKVALLDGQIVECDEDTLLIADHAGGVALGGVMGGLESAVSDDTKNILLEGAHFRPSAVRGRTLRYGVVSEAAFRFERGVDPTMPPRALSLAAWLLTALAGGKSSGVQGTSNWRDNTPPPQAEITTSGEAIRSVLGTTEIADDAAVHLLNAVGITTAPANKKDSTIIARPPSWRFDLEYPADLTEEVIRGWGYERLRETVPQGGRIPSMPPRPFAPSVARRRLAAAGFTETITYAFVSARWEDILNTERGTPLCLQNPISAEMSVMRTTLLGGLLDRAVFNLNRKHDRIRLFEIGRCFVGNGVTHNSAVTADDSVTNSAAQNTNVESANIDEKWRQTQPLYAAGLCAGGAHPVQWGQDSRMADFYDMRGVLEDFLHPAKPAVRFVPFAEINGDSNINSNSTINGGAETNDAEVTPLNFNAKITEDSQLICPNYLHPGQAAAIVYGDVLLGTIGALHPAAAAAFALRVPPFVFEISLEPLLAQRGVPQTERISHFPLVRRDLSVSAPGGTTAAAVLICAQQATSGTAVCDVTLFDCYESDKIKGGRIFYGIRLTMQGTESNLTDDDINRVQDAVVQALSAVGMELRQ